jgi:hypothetical protein
VPSVRAKFLGGPKDGEWLWIGEDLLQRARRYGSQLELNFDVTPFRVIREEGTNPERERRQVVRYFGFRASALAEGLPDDLYYFTLQNIRIVRSQVPATDLQMYRWDTLQHSLDHYTQQQGWIPIWDTYRAEYRSEHDFVLGEVAAYKS